MTREQAKELLPAIQHFSKGGNLWNYNNGREKWEVQTSLLVVNYTDCNIIEDEHFIVRKALAMGEEIETNIGSTTAWKPTTKIESYAASFHYRVKPKDNAVSYIKESVEPFNARVMKNNQEWTEVVIVAKRTYDKGHIAYIAEDGSLYNYIVKLPVYEWQWLIQYSNSDYELTKKYYNNSSEFTIYGTTVEKFEPSKRIRQE